MAALRRTKRLIYSTWRVERLHIPEGGSKVCRTLRTELENSGCRRADGGYLATDAVLHKHVPVTEVAETRVRTTTIIKCAQKCDKGDIRKKNWPNIC